MSASIYHAKVYSSPRRHLPAALQPALLQCLLVCAAVQHLVLLAVALVVLHARCSVHLRSAAPTAVALLAAGSAAAARLPELSGVAAVASVCVHRSYMWQQNKLGV
jgi:hypothetical protein